MHFFQLRLRIAAYRTAAIACVLAPALVLGACREAPDSGATPKQTSFPDTVDVGELMPSPATQALVDSLIPRLVRLSGLSITNPLRVRRQTRDQVHAYVDKRLTRETPAEELAGLHDTYALLGLIPDSVNLRQMLLDLYTEQVIGYYDAASKTMFVLDGADAIALRPVLAHELVHALQDQHVNVDSLISAKRGNDASAAAHAALEGHATMVMFTLLAEDAEHRQLDPGILPSPAEQLRAGLDVENPQYPMFSSAPMIIRETVMFPYIAGSEFMHQLWANDNSHGYSAPFGRNMPQSTEQVLHPNTSFLVQRDAPTELRFAAAPPAGWRVRREESFGELETGLLLKYYLGRTDASLAEGWDGDRYQLLQDASGKRAFAWYSVWDDGAAAQRFTAAMTRLAMRRGDQRTMTVDRLLIGGRPGVRVIDVPARMTPPVVATPQIVH